MLALDSARVIEPGCSGVVGEAVFGSDLETVARPVEEPRTTGQRKLMVRGSAVYGGEYVIEKVDQHGLLRREFEGDDAHWVGPHVQWRAVRPFMVDGVAYRPPGVAGRQASHAGAMICYRSDAAGMCGSWHWSPPQCPTALALLGDSPWRSSP